MDVEKARSHPSADWSAYFDSIRTECPWSWRAWQQGAIDIVTYEGVSQPLGHYQARMYVVSAPDATVTALADMFNNMHTQDEWLWSFPGYGAWATPVSVLIQQDRAVLTKLRDQIDAK